ncbi:MAG: CRTAC1 family protein [Bryobacteraceae bacterium]|nr:CRTAC1 family protein [Bryobacteraceae bacterium]
MRGSSGFGLFLCILLAGVANAQNAASPIHFTFRSIPFTLDNSETPRRHAPETMAGGLAVFDYDGDGDLDIFFTNGADIRTLKKTSPKYFNRLFANDGKGNFTDVTEKAGVAGYGYDTGVAVADYDNDGDLDMFVAGVHRYTFYRNNGDGTFTDFTSQAGLDKPDLEFGPLWAVGAAWVDVNRDGLLDLFVVNYLSWDPKTEPTCQYEGALEYCHPRLYKELPNRLYLNNGDGTFTDISQESGIRAHPGKGMGVCVADFDLDGRMDIFVANDKLFNFLFHDKGGAKFDEVAFEAGVALPEHGNFISGMGVDCRDIDNDSYPDIAFVALDNETFPLFRNTGKNLLFEEVTSSSGLTRQSRPMAGYSPAIYDFDNDGWKDLFVTRGHVQSPFMSGRVQVDQHNSVFRNIGKGKMVALTEEAGFTAQPPRRHRGSAQGDLNGDGLLDIVVSALQAPAEIWINDSPGANRWLALDLQGTTSNRDGIGARIKLVTKNGPQYNHVSSAVGYASASAGPVHFGLGDADVADLIEIHWPSGIVQRLEKVKANQRIKVTEPAKP